jgi:hypothetical protein
MEVTPSSSRAGFRDHPPRISMGIDGLTDGVGSEGLLKFNRGCFNFFFGALEHDGYGDLQPSTVRASGPVREYRWKRSPGYVSHLAALTALTVILFSLWRARDHFLVITWLFPASLLDSSCTVTMSQCHVVRQQITGQSGPSVNSKSPFNQCMLLQELSVY